MKLSSINITTKALLTCGILAGPVYVLVTLFEMFIRPGFDPTRHDWSLLSNGDLGWIHIANFFVTGALVVAAAVGVNRVLKGRWAALLLGLYGIGLIVSGIFVADPMNGFPLGTPEGAPVSPTIYGLMHIISGALAFIGLIGACFVFAKHFFRSKARGLAIFSLVTGIGFLGAFFGIASSSQYQGTALQIIVLTFTAAVVLAWIWLGVVSAHLRNKNYGVKGII